MAEPARDDEVEFTPEDLRQFLRLLRKFLSASSNDVDRRKPTKVVRDREPPPEAYDDVINRRKRRGGDGT